MMIRVLNHPQGPRLYLVGKRIHHGPAFGLAALCTWRRNRVLAIGCAAYAVSDWRDFPFRDCDNH